MAEPVLEARNLHTTFFTKEGEIRAVRGVSFSLEPGKILAIVGESGCGKSTLALSLLRLVPFPGKILRGEVHLAGRNLMSLTDEELRKVRGRQMSMIFQDPISGLNPVLPIGKQVEEILTSHLDVPKKERKQRTLEILRRAGLPDPERIASSYPFHLSGGMCQRVMIGMATALNPSVIIADEPTSSLDVTVQAQILNELDTLRRTKGTAIVLITHDLGVVAQMADDVAVMYAGGFIEEGDVEQIYRAPRHPYTWALLSTLPRLDGRHGQLHAIPGVPPNLAELPEECPFLPRCTKATMQCRTEPAPSLSYIGESGQRVACYNPVFQGWHEDE
ncbi:MAG: ABC transporter ATP-binding protein [Chloroflexi bacterium]|nr:ABC transporter ATP-binding protein [Chloroflexota bacterium]